jgi:hypothetical protein
LPEHEVFVPAMFRQCSVNAASAKFRRILPGKQPGLQSARRFWNCRCRLLGAVDGGGQEHHDDGVVSVVGAGFVNGRREVEDDADFAGFERGRIERGIDPVSMRVI